MNGSASAADDKLLGLGNNASDDIPKTAITMVWYDRWTDEDNRKVEKQKYRGSLYVILAFNKYLYSKVVT